MSIQELAELAPNVKREMVALPFQSERQNELALLGLVRLSASILRKRARVCAVEATFESLREFLLLSLLLNERDLLRGMPLENPGAGVDSKSRGLGGGRRACIGRGCVAPLKTLPLRSWRVGGACG